MSKDCYKVSTTTTIKGVCDIIDNQPVIRVEPKDGEMMLVKIFDLFDNIAGGLNITLTITDEEDYIDG